VLFFLLKSYIWDMVNHRLSRKPATSPPTDKKNGALAKKNAGSSSVVSDGLLFSLIELGQTLYSCLPEVEDTTFLMLFEYRFVTESTRIILEDDSDIQFCHSAPSSGSYQ
jgi:hypothetical protein